MGDDGCPRLKYGAFRRAGRECNRVVSGFDDGTPTKVRGRLPAATPSMGAMVRRRDCRASLAMGGRHKGYGCFADAQHDKGRGAKR